jgi:hypothetical protein
MIFCGPGVAQSVAEEWTTATTIGLGGSDPQLQPMPPSPLWRRFARNVLPPVLVKIAQRLRRAH